MALDIPQKVRIRRALGYPNVRAVGSATFGIPALRQPAFLLELSMDQLLPDAEPILLKELDTFECLEALQRGEAIDTLLVERLGGVSLRDAAPDRIEREIVRHGKNMADILGVMPYPYSQRYSSSAGGAGQAGMIPVVRG